MNALREPLPVLSLLAAILVGTILLVRGILGHRLVLASSRHLRLKADTILDRVADGIIVTDSAGSVLQCNPAGERLIGSRSPVGLSCARAVGLRTADGPLDCSKGCALLGLGDRGDSGAGREVWRQRPDGRRQSLLVSVSVVGDRRNRMAEVVHSLRDISRLKEADEAKTLFLATASHELKTPLTVISGFTDAMLAFPDMSKGQREEALASVHTRALELGGIIERLLLSSTIEAGRAEIRQRQLAVVPLLRQRGDAVQTATARPILTELRDDGLVVGADPLALGTVLDHLLENAVKYSEGGFVVLRAEASGDGVAISVTDSGIGMDDEQAARCFDKFWQAESTDVRRFGGTGIGLYIVKSLVTAMGGTITLQSAPDRGSRFTVWLPAAVPARADATGTEVIGVLSNSARP
ncbi:MAG: PAS domain-containing sensor histidine kinase [Actinomycetota bacterium]|nr:PAS domain-containing sensor histidine kinase [Actinomycetota bacterium]